MFFSVVLSERFFDVARAVRIGCTPIVFVESMTDWSVRLSTVEIITVVDLTRYFVDDITCSAVSVVEG